jgi:hypothetical protein
MTATEWKNKGRAAAEAEAVDLELPSGMTIKARRPDAIQVAMWGQLPLGLAAAVQATNGEAAGPASVEEIRAGIALSRDILAYCCVSPSISLDPKGENAIHPKDIPMGDVMFILRWARRGEEADALRTFRDERQSAGAGGDGGEVRSEAIGIARVGRFSVSSRSGPRGGDGDPNGAE